MHIARRWIGVYCFHLSILEKHDHEGEGFRLESHLLLTT
jgi:hypothetical protein